MSASLVGSEMCIRDRCSHAPIVQMFCEGVSALARGTRSQDATAERARIPVSYTHLTLPTICSV
eukprot:14658626-Alexandrium_andersonii.AAC.1